MSIVDQSPSFVMKEGLKSNTSSTPGSVPFPRTKRSLGSSTAKLSQIMSLYKAVRFDDHFLLYSQTERAIGWSKVSSKVVLQVYGEIAILAKIAI